MQKKKNAFTLIELLAVIVILAIIALIAVPVILNIIDKANKSAFKDTTYGILSAGKLYWAERQLEVNGMQEEEKTFTLPGTTNTLGLKGNIPTNSITITRDGNISLMIKNERYCLTKGYDDEDVTITEEFETCELPIGGSGNQGTGGSGEKTLKDVMVSTTNNCVTIGQCTLEQISTDEGIKVTINVKEGETKDFYVLADDGNKVTLIMSENLGDNVAWFDSGKSTEETTDSDNSNGPITALAELTSLTNDWKIPEITYALSGKGEDGQTQKYPDSQVTAKARLLTYAEANAIGCTTTRESCPNWMYGNLNNTGSDRDGGGCYKIGYWLSTASASDAYAVWDIS